MRILFIGDVVGRTGREAVGAVLPRLREALRIDLAVVNAENASHGFGLGPDMATALFAAGADVITLGNHAWDRKEIIPFIADHPRLLRPLNYPPGTPGSGAIVVDVGGGRRALVLQAMGRLYMDALDCPFRGIAAELTRHRLGGPPGSYGLAAIFVDFHAEASSEKMAFAHFLDGQVSAVVGTHTHCPSADAQILPGGTAFQSDAGMSGDYDSVIGMQKSPATLLFLAQDEGREAEPRGGRGNGVRRFRGDGRRDRAGEADRTGAAGRAARSGDAGGAGESVSLVVPCEVDLRNRAKGSCQGEVGRERRDAYCATRLGVRTNTKRLPSTVDGDSPSHGRDCRGHPRLAMLRAAKTWVIGPSPASFKTGPSPVSFKKREPEPSTARAYRPTGRCGSARLELCPGTPGSG